MQIKDILSFCGMILLIISCSFTPQPRYQNVHKIAEEVIEEQPVIDLSLENELDADRKNEISIATEIFEKTEMRMEVEEIELPATVRIIATGDIMLGTRLPDESYLPKINGNDLFGTNVKEILKSGDIVFGNLEGAICGSGGKAKKKKYVFAMPDQAAEWLFNAGYNLLSVANNHAGDMGNVGCENTRLQLDKFNIIYAGYLDYPSTIFEKKNIRFGFIAASPNAGVVYLHDKEWLISEVRKLALQCNIVIVSMHIGAEGKDHQHITRKTEKFLGENRGNPYQFAREMIDAGADLVLGHGPHVTRAIDLYKNKFIAYSLGNFCTVSRVNLSGISGIAPILELDLDIEGNFQSGTIYSTRQIPRKGIRMDDENLVLQKIIELTKEDIQEVPLIISDDGLIIPK